MIELAKMAWSPVLELLGREVRFEELASKPYLLHNPLTALPPPLNGTEVKYWLDPDEILRIHDEMVRTFTGALGVRDQGMIESTVARMRESAVMGHDPLPTVFDKAAFLMHSILRYHPFVDGQKRTGLSSAFIFLGMNGYYLWSREAIDEVHFAVQVAKGEFEVPEISEWIRQRVASRQSVRDPEVVDRLLRSTSKVARRTCTACKRGRLRLNRYTVSCPNCDAVFEVRLNAALVMAGGKGSREPRVVVQPGLRLVGYVDLTPETGKPSLKRFAKPS